MPCGATRKPRNSIPILSMPGARWGFFSSSWDGLKRHMPAMPGYGNSTSGSPTRYDALRKRQKKIPRLSLPSPRRNHEKNIWAAAAASAVCPGLGQVYTSGKYGKGWTILAALFLSALAGIFLDAFKGTYLLAPLAPYQAALPSLTLLLPVLVWIYSIIHAVWKAYEVNNHREPFIEVRIARLAGYIVSTYIIAALLYLYLPLVSSLLYKFFVQAAALP